MRIVSSGDETNRNINISIKYNKDKIQELINLIIEEFTYDGNKSMWDKDEEITLNSFTELHTFASELEKTHKGTITNIEEIKQSQGGSKYKFIVKKYPKIVSLLYRIIENDEFDEVFRIIFSKENLKYKLLLYKDLFDEEDLNNLDMFKDIIKNPGKKYMAVRSILEPKHYINFFIEKCLYIEINTKKIDANEDIITTNELVDLNIYPDFEKQKLVMKQKKEKYGLSLETAEYYKSYEYIPIEDIFILNDFKKYLDKRFRISRFHLDTKVYDDSGNVINQNVRSINGAQRVFSDDEISKLKIISSDTYLEQAEQYGVCNRNEFKREKAEILQRFAKKEEMVKQQIKITFQEKMDEIDKDESKSNKYKNPYQIY